MTEPANPHPGEPPGDDPLLDPGAEEDAALRARVLRALDLTRPYLTAEEAEEQEHMLLALARTDPRLSSRIEDARPRAVPDRSDVVPKKDDGALRAALARRAGGGGRRA